MKRTKNTPKSISSQRTISSFFTASVRDKSTKTNNDHQLSSVSHSPIKLGQSSHSEHQEPALTSSRHDSTVSHKRKRERIGSASPDFIPATPQTSRESRSEVSSSEKVDKKLFVSPANSVKKGSRSPLKKNSDSSITSGKVVKRKIDIPRREDASRIVQKLATPSPKKVLCNIHIKSPINVETPSPLKTENLKKISLSPIKTEDDEVLKSILEHLSPPKQVSKIPLVQIKPPDVYRSRSLFTEKIVSNEGSSYGKQQVNNKPSISLKSAEHCESPTVKSRRNTGNEAANGISKSKRRKSIKSPSHDTPELTYPPLPFGPKGIVKTKSKEKAMLSNPCNDSSCLKGTAVVVSQSKPDESNSPVRRSPRKHPSSPIASQVGGKIPASGKVSPRKGLGDLQLSEKENKITVAPIRKSPRKHTSVVLDEFPTDKNKMGEIGDLSAEFHDDFSDVMAYMANINETELKQLDFSEAQLCEVASIEIKIPYKEVIIQVKCVQNQSTAYCRVRGCWLACPVSEGDSISLQAAKVDGEWLLDSTRGFLVLHPDNLISGTTVVGSLFCSRRSVISSMFRGMDSDSPIMIIGSIVHELFQMVLREKKTTESEIQELAKQLVSSKSCVRMLYAAGMTLAQIQKELSSFIPRIVEFVGKFVELPRPVQKRNTGSAWLGAPCSKPKVPQITTRDNQGSNWSGKIVGIRDIEETLWDPKLGIKGMVDVSVEVRDMHGNSRVMPLELKTGRASFSAEHRGQVTLYTMMMARLGDTVDSGLLLYLREGQMQEISVSHNERKDLILLRNTLAHYLKPRAPIINEETGQFHPLRMPEPISFRSACEKCPYSTLCSVYLKQKGLSDLPADHPMVSISSTASQHLTQSHIDYVMHWAGLLLLEDYEQTQSAKMRHLWRFPPEERERNGVAIVNLHLVGSVEESNGKYFHTFSRKNSSCKDISTGNLKKTSLSVGDYIIISTDKRVAMERGNIVEIDSLSVKVSTNRNLFDRFAHETFHLDSTESNTVVVFNLTNLGCLLDDKESAERLRKIIIDRVVPTFSVQVDKSIIKGCLPIFRKLNRNQQNAAMKTLRSDSHILIKGLPGTGKTSTMVALVQLLVRAGLSILVTSHTHSAVDNLLLRLKNVGLNFLRLGADARIHPNLQAYSENALTQNCKTPEDLDRVYSHQQIVGVTCLGAGHACLSRRTFDICLVDESTQVLQPSVLRPLLCARRFVLVGDPDQLPPLVQSHQAQKLGLSESLFSRLDAEEATVSLTLNYRMNQIITDLANGLTYEGKLLCGSDSVAKATLRLTSHEIHEKPWLCAALSAAINKSVVFADTSGVAERQAKMSISATQEKEASCSNHFELSLVMELLNAFVNSGISCEEIGVMAPYRAQVSLLAQAIKSNSKLSSIEVNTVDQFQGRDKEVVVYSCTRSDGVSHSKPKDREILNDQRRLTVAITRAKHKLVLIGHCETLQLYGPFKKLLACLSKSNVISVDM